MKLCDEKDTKLEEVIEWTVCGRLEGEKREICESIVKDHYSQLLKCTFVSPILPIAENNTQT